MMIIEDSAPNERTTGKPFAWSDRSELGKLHRPADVQYELNSTQVNAQLHDVHTFLNLPSAALRSRSLAVGSSLSGCVSSAFVLYAFLTAGKLHEKCGRERTDEMRDEPSSVVASVGMPRTSYNVNPTVIGKFPPR